ncbi:hypothetical protein L218DRAFT_955839 [Marasmius fiardii PR-910]|nr:hypothetical protein L218DRAFT_955839 [Marasmius fiardii PR-910]
MLPPPLPQRQRRRAHSRPQYSNPTFAHRMLALREGTTIKSSTGEPHLRDTVLDTIVYLSVVFSAVVIITAVFLSLHPVSKPKTDRVSFRIMIYALLSGSVAYSVATLMVKRIPGQTACRVMGSFVVAGLQLSSFLFFCIGLNLQLVMIHGIDGTRAEKYYVSGSLSLAIVLGILTFASNQLVYNPTQSVCYYYDPNPVRGLLWRIGMQSFWSCLVVVGEIITFVSVVVYMFRVKAFSSGLSRDTTTTRLSASHYYRRPLGPRQYRNVVLRIALYPLSSLLTTGVMAIMTVVSAFDQMRDASDWAVRSALLAAFKSHGIIYALVAAADPAMTQGLKALYKHYVQGADNVVFRSAVTHRHSCVGGLQSEGFRHNFGDGPGVSRRPVCLCEGSTRSVTIPKSVVIPSRRDSDAQLDTSSSCATFIDIRSQSQIDDDVHVVHYSHAQLRQL